MRLRSLVAAVPLASLLLAAAPNLPANAPGPSGYAGQESREIKSLRSQEVDSLLAGEGLGFAKAAELNGYPGPAHVLALADDLGLTPEQRDLTSALFAAMQREAQSVGKTLVQAERELDRLFADRSVTSEALSAVLTRVGTLQATLRGVHLQAHVAQTELLTPAQTLRYAELRGYAGGQPGERLPSHSHGPNVPGNTMPGHGPHRKHQAPAGVEQRDRHQAPDIQAPDAEMPGR